jgi:hypothetical protein
MDRKYISRNGSVGTFCATALLLIAAQSFGVVTNGFFDTSLSGWQSNDASGVSLSSTGFYDEAGNGTASLHGDIPGSLPSSALWQTFYVNPNSTSLTFQVRTPLPLIDETDHFYIQLLNSASVPVPILGNPGNDYFFHWKSGKEYDADPDAGWIESETPAGISVSEGYLMKDENPDWAYLLYSFEIPIETDWFDKNVTLRFELNNDYNDIIATSILIDNVVLHVPSSDTPVVPAPSAIGLVLSGLAALGVFAKKLT